jgi:hypothetical protein
MSTDYFSLLPEFTKSLGKYRKPRRHEVLSTGRGTAKVQAVLGYEQIIEEMKLDGAPENEIKRFNLRIENFLGDKKRDFECSIAYEDGETERIDWSEYLGLKNKTRRR